MKGPKCIHTTSVEKYSLLGKMTLPWDQDGKLYYRIMNYTNKMPVAYQNQAIENAFREWNFYLCEYGREFVRTVDPNKAYVRVQFGGGDTGNIPPEPYDLELSDPWCIAFWVKGTGDIYLNDVVKWNQDVDLFTALIHEIGHLQGIAHTQDSQIDVMNERYKLGNRITQDSVAALRRLYGKHPWPIFDLSVFDIIFTVITGYLLYKLFL